MSQVRTAAVLADGCLRRIQLPSGDDFESPIDFSANPLNRQKRVKDSPATQLSLHHRWLRNSSS